MKKHFKGYYKLTAKQIQSIWENGFISLDANSIFNLYRYSEDTSKALLGVYERYSSQLWLPHQVAFEFHKNRLSVISTEITTYVNTKESFSELENKIIKNVRSPHLSKPVQKSFEKSLNEIKKDLDKKIKYYEKLLTTDHILSSISRLFKDKVGDSFDYTTIKAIEKEGEERYRNKVPPGYMDNGKSDNKYGDLIMWKELMRKAKTDDLPFILITDDVKEDWWAIIASQSETIQNEVIEEVRDVRNQPFTYNLSDEQLSRMSSLYSADLFSTKYDKFLKQNEALQELGSLSAISPNIDNIRTILKENPLLFTPKFNFNLDDLQNASRAIKTLGALGYGNITPNPNLPDSSELLNEE
jgi:hypothetical protein